MSATSLPPLDWKQFEQSLLNIYWQQVQSFLAAHPQEQIYAFALDSLYRETDGPIYLPTLAANSEQAYADMVSGYDKSAQFADFVLDTGQLGSLRWNPPDWEWEELDDAGHAGDHQAFEQLGLTLIAEANRSTTAHWHRTEARLLKMLVSICKALTKACKQSVWAGQLTKQFAVLVCLADAHDSELLAKQSVGDARFAQLFPSHDKSAQRRKQVAAMPVAEQLRFHIACLQGQPNEEFGLSAEDALMLQEEAQVAVLNMEPSIAATALLALLQSPIRWKAAMLLSQLAYKDEQILQALRQHVARPLKHRHDESALDWCARALGALNDHEWLLAQCLSHSMPPERVAAGLSHPFHSWGDKPGAKPVRLNYQPLEQALSLAPYSTPEQAVVRELQDAIADELKPGCGYCELHIADLDEALRGLQSSQALIRIHAAVIMGERSLGAAAGKSILPALAHALRHDMDEDVRYQAMLSLKYWKKAATSHRSDIEYAALHDPSDDVRELAQQWLDDYR